MKLLFYISGHGFGHASRATEVIRVLLERRPDLRIVVKSPAPDWFFQERIPVEFEHDQSAFDTGVVQSDSLTLDPLHTLKSYSGFRRGQSRLLRREAGPFRRRRPRLIIGDIPSFAFRLAARLRVPSLALANFSWDWIYEPYAVSFPRYQHLVDALREEYALADALLRLPFSAPMEAFRRVKDVPLIARASAFSREEAKVRLGLPRERPVILLSFGGFGLGDEYYLRLSADRNFCWIASERVGAEAEGIINFQRAELARQGLGYPDLVRAADAVITKPGYGILSECVANRTRILYTSRGDFREYDILVDAARKHLPSLFIPPEKLKTGRAAGHLEKLLSLPGDFSPVPLNGAEVCAGIILETIGL